jgi:hypothetical protein
VVAGLADEFDRDVRFAEELAILLANSVHVLRALFAASGSVMPPFGFSKSFCNSAFKSSGIVPGVSVLFS